MWYGIQKNKRRGRRKKETGEKNYSAKLIETQFVNSREKMDGKWKLWASQKEASERKIWDTQRYRIRITLEGDFCQCRKMS